MLVNHVVFFVFLSLFWHVILVYFSLRSMTIFVDLLFATFVICYVMRVDCSLSLTLYVVYSFVSFLYIYIHVYIKFLPFPNVSTCTQGKSVY